MDRLAKKVCETIRRERLFEPGAAVVVGVSGGADSVALLLLLRELAPVLKLRLSVAHFNHRWRGRESDADEAFVTVLAARLGLPFRSGRAGRKPSQNREARAREDRYRFLCTLAIETGADLAVAHHADDQAETFLLNLLRGAGPDGLSGMAPAGPAAGFPAARLVRPLLSVTRAELRDYLGRQKQDWREDSSNSDLDLLRNRVRAEVLPVLASINPAVVETMGRTSAILREQSEAARLLASGWVEENAAEREDEVLLPLGPLRSLPPALRLAILREGIRRLSPGLGRLSRRHLSDLDRLALARDHGSLDLPGLSAVKQYDLLGLRRAGKHARSGQAPAESPRGQARALQIPGRVEWEGPSRKLVVISARLGRVPTAKDFFAAAAIDPKKVAGGLQVRGRRPGDRYRPAGCEGRRSLKDVFNELRVPPLERDSWPLIVDDEEIIWVPGMRPAEKAAVRSSDSIVVLSISPRGGLRNPPAGSF